MRKGSKKVIKETPPVSTETISPSQAYANRVWAGQCPEMPRQWRIDRVKAALAGQNLPFEGVELG